MRSGALPRNMSLTAFNPHHPTFECKREADEVPPIDPQAEEWLQEGLRITGSDRRFADRHFPDAALLWSQAAERNHWKALTNLAGLYGQGNGLGANAVRADPERAVRIVESAMVLEVPAAFYAMGMYHYTGLGVRADSSRAYAFWQLAADMGSADAQARIGRALLAVYDNPKEKF